MRHPTAILVHACEVIGIIYVLSAILTAAAENGHGPSLKWATSTWPKFA